jgi:mRNA interferase RelE/StbE
MKLQYEESFKRDIKKIKNSKILQNLKEIIHEIITAENSLMISGIKKIQGSKYFYRIKTGNYRIGIEIKNNEIILMRFLHRKDIYKFFP